MRQTTSPAGAISGIEAELPPGTRLVAVSKYHPAGAVREAYEAGQRLFGESHAQELEAKRRELPADIEWHFIGHLQTNKVRLIAPYVSLIHSVDTPRLLAEISRQGERCGRVIPCLLQLHVAREETKFGFTPQECLAYLESGQWRSLRGARIAGLMCMASNVALERPEDGERQVEGEFHVALDVFRRVKERYFTCDDGFRERSWGMSADYKVALRCGSTMVRIGTRIFGERAY